MVYVQLIIN